MAELTEQTFQKLIDEQKKTTQALGQVSMLQQDNIDVGKDNVKQGELFGPPISPEEQEKQNKKMQKVRDAKNAKEPSWFGKVGAFIMGGKARKKEDKKEQEGGFKRFGKMIGGGFKELGGKLKDQLPSKASVKSFFTKSLLAALFLMMPKILNSDILKKVIRILDEKLPKVFNYLKEGFGKVANLFDDFSIKNFFELFTDGGSGSVVAGIGLLTAMFLPFGVGKILRGTLGLGLKALKLILFDLPVGLGKLAFFSKKGNATMFTKIGTKLSGLKGVISGFAGKVVGAFKTGLSAIGTGAKKVGKTGLNLAKGGLKAVGGLAKGALRFAGPIALIATAATGIFGAVKGGLEEAKKEGATKMSIARESLAGAVNALTFGLIGQEGISNALQSAGDKIGETYTKIKDSIPTMEDVKNAIPTMEEITGGIDKVGDSIKAGVEVMSEKFDVFAGKVGTIKDSLVQNFEKITGVELPTMDEVTDKLKEFGSNLKARALSFVGDAKEKLASIGEGAKKFVTGLFKKDENDSEKIDKAVQEALKMHFETQHKAIDDFGGVGEQIARNQEKEAASTNIVSADNSVRSSTSTTVVQSESITPSYGGYRMVSTESDYG